MRYCLLIPLLEANGINIQISHLNFFFLTFSIVLLAAAGYIINDINDVEPDKVNKPDKVIVGKNISAKSAEAIYMVINAVAIGLGVYIAYSIKIQSVSISFVLVAGLLYFYSGTYKGQIILGNLMVSIFAAFVPLLVLIFELPLLKAKYSFFISSTFNFNFLIAWFGFYALFAFLTNLMREIIKDIEDFEGDSAFGQNTLPVKFGTQIAKYVVLGLISITIALVIFILFKYLHNLFTIVYAIPLIITPLLYLFWIVYSAKEKKDYSWASKVCKYTMVAGVMYIILVKFILLNH